MMESLADMPSCLGGGDHGINNCTCVVANRSVEVRVLLLQPFSAFKAAILWSDEIWQTCPLVSGVGIKDKYSVMPAPTQIGSDWG